MSEEAEKEEHPQQGALRQRRYDMTETTEITATWLKLFQNQSLLLLEKLNELPLDAEADLCGPPG